MVEDVAPNVRARILVRSYLLSYVTRFYALALEERNRMITVENDGDSRIAIRVECRPGTDSA